MARRRIPVRKIKEVLRLRFGLGLSERQIAGAVNIGSSTVNDYLARAVAAGVTWPLPVGMDDAELNRRLFVRNPPIAASTRAVPDWKAIRKELSKKEVTRQLLWEEYRTQEPDGYSYTRFCELYAEWAAQLDPTMRMDHKAGERIFVDYTGLSMSYLDAETGQPKEATLFVAAFGASSYTFCEAHVDETLENWISGHIRACDFFGGVPEIVVPDNLKTGVRRACRYEPDLNPTYHELAMHYGMAVIPTRVRAPRDKAKVEAAVQVVEQRVMAPLRNDLFVGIGALNAAIRVRLDALNNRTMRHLDASRRELFETIDRPALRPLPDRAFEPGVWRRVRVAIDYHVLHEWHAYSVPCELIHQEVEIRVTARVVEVFAAGVRVASHRRSHVRGGHTTLTEHMPESHRRFVEWTPERVAERAADIGPNTTALIEAVAAEREHPAQAFRSALGIVRLADRYSEERLEAAARRAIHFCGHSYTAVRNILKARLDTLPLEDDPLDPPARGPLNVRGREYYS